jgi:type II secretion system protein D
VLRDLLGARLQLVRSSDPQRAQYHFRDAAGRSALLTIDWRSNELVVAAAAPLLNQFVRLISALDALPAGGDKAVRVIPLRRADPAQVRDAVEAYRTGTRPAPAGSHTAKPDHGAVRPGGVLSALYAGSPRVPDGSLRLASYADDPTAEAAPAKAPPEQAPPVEPKAAPRSPLSELNSDIEVETLPDLDAVILRGRPRDVEQLRRIIAEIERLSAETRPAIEVYPLKHVAAEPLNTLIREVILDVVGGQQGRILVMPLIKPNALLLIGWGEAVKSIKELIDKLDQPVTPETQMRVFRLRHASAGQAMATVDSFLAGRTGLGPKAKVVADARTNSLIVHASPRDLAEVQLLVDRLDVPQGDAVRRARVFKLSNSLAADVAAVLQAAISGSRGGAAPGPGALPGAASAGGGGKSAALELLTVDGTGQRLVRAGVLDDVQITPDSRTNSLIVAGPPESMELLAALIKQLDSPTGVAQIKVFRIINGDATAMVAMLRTLMPSSAGGAPGTLLALAEGETTALPIRFSVDTRTNSIIAAGSEGDLAIIEALLLRIDEDKGQQRKNAVYRLKNAPAADVARSINEFLRTERQVQQVATGMLNPFQQIESEVVVVPEVVSNSLIISATPRFFTDIKELVEKLDAEPPQVMIQLLIAEVTLGKTDEFGVELGIQDSVLFDRSLLGNLITVTETKQQSTPSGIITNTQQNIVSATNEPGYNFNNTPLGNSGSSSALSNAATVGSQALSSFATGRLNSELGFGGLVLSASSKSISALLRALQECRRLEVLSRPQVMTLDNQPAFVQVGKRVPRIVGSSMNQLGQQNALVLENVGLILGVTPRISPDGRVVMEVDAEKSELAPLDEGIPVSAVNNVIIKSPSINLTTAQTTVSSTDGETIVIGGLITKSKTDVDRRVPGLSQIPLLGALFRYQSHVNRRTEMLIILTPHIVRNAAEAERIRQVEEAQMNWCLAAVNAMHGPMGTRAKTQGRPAPTVYPDSNPRGVLQEPEPSWSPPEAVPPGAKFSPGEPMSRQPQPLRVQPGAPQPGGGPALIRNEVPGPVGGYPYVMPAPGPMPPPMRPEMATLPHAAQPAVWNSGGPAWQGPPAVALPGMPNGVIGPLDAPPPATVPAAHLEPPPGTANGILGARYEQ